MAGISALIAAGSRLVLALVSLLLLFDLPDAAGASVFFLLSVFRYALKLWQVHGAIQVWVVRSRLLSLDEFRLYDYAANGGFLFSTVVK